MKDMAAMRKDAKKDCNWELNSVCAVSAARFACSEEYRVQARASPLVAYALLVAIERWLKGLLEVKNECIGEPINMYTRLVLKELFLNMEGH